MNVVKTNLQDCFVIEPRIFEDERGFFLETFQKERYETLAGINMPFVQDNHSRSSKNVLRGLHFQKKKPQGKLVRVVRGEIYDVVVDIRKGSRSYKNWQGFLISSKNKNQVWVPPGFAHGFLVMSDTADVEYKVTEYYDAEDETSLLWNDKGLNIDWLIDSPSLSERDKNALSFKDLDL